MNSIRNNKKGDKFWTIFFLILNDIVFKISDILVTIFSIYINTNIHVLYHKVWRKLKETVAIPFHPSIPSHPSHPLPSVNSALRASRVHLPWTPRDTVGANTKIKRFASSKAGFRFSQFWIANQVFVIFKKSFTNFVCDWFSSKKLRLLEPNSWNSCEYGNFENGVTPP